MVSGQPKSDIDTRWLMDKAARVAYLIRTSPGRFERSQLFRLAEVLEATRGDAEALMATALYAHRQVERGEIPRDVAKELGKVLLEIKDRAPPDEVRGLAREFLGYLRWFFEATERVRLPRAPSLDKVDADWFLKQLSGR